MLNDLINWWNALGGAEQVFWAIGLISNLLFVAYIALQWSGTHDADIHIEHPDAGFALLSVRSLLAFFMFMGWTGVLVLRQEGSVFMAITAGALAGFLAAWLAYRLFRVLLRLQSSGNLEWYNAVGKKGHVHLYIPAGQSGAGKVMVEVQGALRELDAVTESDVPIPTGSSILVVGVDEQNRLIVQVFS